MPSTPSRRARDQETELQSREAGRLANEMKYTEFQLGCSAGEAHACTSLGEWYSVMRSDFVKAAELYTEACLEKRHPQACLNMGMFLSAGRPGVPPSPPQAIEVLSLGCEVGNGDACAEAGRLLLRSGSGSGAIVARAEGVFHRGCHNGAGTSNAKCCGLYAALHLSPTLGPALAASAAAKEGSSSPTSTPLTPSTSTSTTPKDLVGLLERACSGEHAPSCMKLAEGYWGRVPALGLPKDEGKARALEATGLQWSGLSPQQAARTVEQKHGKMA